MDRTQHPSNNHVLGAPAGHDQEQLPIGALPITRVQTEDGVMVQMSFWRPNAAELEALAAGHLVVLQIYGGMHPPVAVGVAI